MRGRCGTPVHGIRRGYFLIVVLLFFLASIREVTTDNDAAKDEGIINIVPHCCYSPGPLYSLTLLPYDIAPAVNKDLPALRLVAQAAAEGTQTAVPRVVQLGVKTSDMLNAGILKVGALKPVAAMRNSSVVNNASNWVGWKFYGKTVRDASDLQTGSRKER